MTAYDDERETGEPDTRDPEAEVTPPSVNPDAVADPEIEEILADEKPPEEDPYNLRSGLRPEGTDSDPGSLMNL